MQKKEIKKWQDEEALKRYRMIAPLLDEGKRRQMREEAAEKNGISKRSLYRYEAGYRDNGFEGLRPMSRTKKRMQRLPDNFDEVMEQAMQLKREVPKRQNPWTPQKACFWKPPAGTADWHMGALAFIVFPFIMIRCTRKPCKREAVGGGKRS